MRSAFIPSNCSEIIYKISKLLTLKKKDYMDGFISIVDAYSELVKNKEENKIVVNALVYCFSRANEPPQMPVVQVYNSMELLCTKRYYDLLRKIVPVIQDKALLIINNKNLPNVTLKNPPKSLSYTAIEEYFKILTSIF